VALYSKHGAVPDETLNGRTIFRPRAAILASVLPKGFIHSATDITLNITVVVMYEE